MLTVNAIYTLSIAVKLGIGGFSMGAATALYSATCFAHGKYGNGYPYTVNLRAIVGLSGWLPGARCVSSYIAPQINPPQEMKFRKTTISPF